MPEFRAGSTGSVVIDDRYAPLIVATFVGEVDLPLGQWYEETSYRIILREAARGRRVVNIHDASRSTKAGPDMRKFWADMKRRTPPGVEAAVLANLLVITSAVMRGVITAVGWMNPEVAALKTFPSLDAALAEAGRLLVQAGTPFTLPAGGYNLPREGARQA
jgi:hypothetical protein